MRKSRKSLIIDYKTVFESEAGKAVRADLKKKAMLLDAVNLKEGIDPNKLLVLQGRKDVVLHIYRMLGLDPYEEREEKAQGE